MKRLFVFGLGFCARVVVARAVDFAASGTTRSPETAAALRDKGFDAFAFADPNSRQAARAADVLMVSAPPDAAGDPALAVYAEDIAKARNLSRVVYLSTVGVYGGADGAWVDETAPTLGGSPRARWRVAAEARWRDLGREIGVPVDVLRLAGIYGPGRNALVKLREGTARRIVKPGQVFNRIHVVDIAGVAMKLIAAGGAGGVWNVADREPAPPQDVVAYAAGLIGIEPPPEEPFETAEMTPMARSFYADNRRVATEKLASQLGYVWNFPTYREGLADCYAAGDGRIR